MVSADTRQADIDRTKPSGDLGLTLFEKSRGRLFSQIGHKGFTALCSLWSDRFAGVSGP